MDGKLIEKLSGKKEKHLDKEHKQEIETWKSQTI